jgi:hypothetical protein
MQQTAGIKRFFVTHVALMVIAIVVLIGVALGAGGLGATGNLPWTDHSHSRSAAIQRDAAASSQEVQAAQVQQMQRCYQHKEARLEESELQRSALAAQAKRQDAIDRYIRHKEQTLDAPR